MLYLGIVTGGWPFAIDGESRSARVARRRLRRLAFVEAVDPKSKMRVSVTSRDETVTSRRTARHAAS